MPRVASFEPSHLAHVKSMINAPGPLVVWKDPQVQWTRSEMRFHLEGTLFGRAILLELGVPVLQLFAEPGSSPILIAALSKAGSHANMLVSSGMVITAQSLAFVHEA
jgi:hypothetical protein